MSINNPNDIRSTPTMKTKIAALLATLAFAGAAQAAPTYLPVGAPPLSPSLALKWLVFAAAVAIVAALFVEGSHGLGRSRRARPGKAAPDLRLGPCGLLRG